MMKTIDLTGKTALITGGTQGIGYSTAVSFGSAGAKVCVTCKWGSADEETLRTDFRTRTGGDLTIVNADVSVDDDTEHLLDEIETSFGAIDIFVSNVGFAPQVKTLEEYKKKSFFKTLEYSSWPLVEYTKKIHKRFGRYPSHVVAISSDGPDHYYRGYDYVSAAKAMLEHFARYLSVHLLAEGSRVNVIRFGTVKTASFDAIFGNDFFDFLSEAGLPKEYVLTPDECGKAVLALVSGLLDAMNGQVLTVDFGLPFQDNLMMRYLDWRDAKHDNQGETT